MQGRLLFFSLLACLSLSLQVVDAQDLDSLAFAAAEYELRLYDCAADETVGLLLAKAACQEEAAAWEEALATLGRIPMFALDDTARAGLAKDILHCQFMSGRYGDFESTLDEALLMRLFDEETCATIESYLESNPARYRNEDTALILSALPGFGHLYAGKPVQGLGHLALNGVVIAAGVAAFCSGLYAAAFLGGGMVLARTHSENSASAVKAVAEYNREVKKERCASILDIIHG